MKTPIFTGSGVALVTPFMPDDVMAINFDKLGELVEFHIANGTQALIICGTTGEASTQKVPEHLNAIKYCVEKAAGRIKVIGGTGSNDTDHALMMCHAVESFGADGFLMVTPYYNKTSQHGLVKHYLRIADEVKLPIILYNVPSRTGLSFTEGSYKALSEHPLINGVKEASGNLQLITRTRALCGDELFMWSGNDDQVVPLMSLGGKGVISVTANILPAVSQRLCELCLDGDFKAASELQIKLQALNDALFCEVNPVPVKAAMNLLGFNVGDVRMPLDALLPENVEKLKAAMKGVNLL